MDLDLCEHGLAACDEVLVAAGLGDIVKAKALDPLKPKDFVTLCERFARTLWRLADPDETRATNAALKTLDLDWGALTLAQRDRALDAAKVAMQAAQAGVLPRLDLEFEARAVKIAEGTRLTAQRRWKLDIEPELSTFDETVAEFVRKSNLMFVTDEFGRRSDGFTDRAREIVAKGLEDGLDRNAIGADLKAALGPEATLGKRRGYWTTVSAAFAGRARSATLVSSFADAKIKTYRIQAMMDERTSACCRLLNGRTFVVKDARQQLAETVALTDPDDIKAAMPWIQEGTDDDGQAIMYVKQRDGSRLTVAEIAKPAFGRDEVGTYRNAMSNADLVAAGIQAPPYHGRCRTTLLLG